MDLPQLREGKNIRVFQKIIEGKRERNVPFTGKILKIRGSGINMTITVRQSLEGIEVERIFSVQSPTITKIEVIEEKEKKRTVKKRRVKK